MIRIALGYDSDGCIRSIVLKGHGNGGIGKDLVCAGVSSCFVGAMNAIQESEKFEFSIKSGNSSCVSKEKPNMHDGIVLETLIVQLKTIQEAYPNEVSVISKKEGEK
ncbi:MAG: ribosomal-processing cysteine protease Prp [Bacilli bacterium]|jgi:uncharacterized protein YsxB (DUF464 family)|nr:ribosomal-processing cysteine protease Prp [Bacilli bacterium]